MKITVLPPWGADVTESYAERYWLPTIGPTGYLMMHKLLRLDGCDYDRVILAVGLGVTLKVLDHTFQRLMTFGLVSINPVGMTVNVHRWPEAKLAHIERLEARTRELADA
jgi:hypothetical protein